MKRCSLSFLVVLGLAAVAWADSTDPNFAGLYDVNDFFLTVDPNSVTPTGIGDYVIDPNKVIDANSLADSAREDDPNLAVDTSSSSDPNAQPLDPNGVSSYDDSNIHSAADIINPIRLLSTNNNATLSFGQQMQNAAPTLSSVSISPASPTTADTVTITFNGRKGANYSIDSIVVTPRGSLIAVDVTWKRAGTTDGAMENYSKTQSLGSLTAGTHTLQIKNYYGNWSCATITKFFTVAASSTGTTGDTGGTSMWDWLLNRMSSTNNSNPLGSWPPFSLE